MLTLNNYVVFELMTWTLGHGTIIIPLYICDVRTRIIRDRRVPTCGYNGPWLCDFFLFHFFTCSGISRRVYVQFFIIIFFHGSKIMSRDLSEYALLYRYFIPMHVINIIILCVFKASDGYLCMPILLFIRLRPRRRFIRQQKSFTLN